MTTDTTNSQAASIDTYDDPRFEKLSTALYRIGFHQAGSGDAEAKALADYIDAKRAQAFNDGAIEGRIHQRGIDAARIDAAESRLAEIQRGVEGMRRFSCGEIGGYGFSKVMGMQESKDGFYAIYGEIRDILAPHGQASDTVEMKG